MPSRRAGALLLLLTLVGVQAAGGRELQAAPYAPSLYHAIVKLKLTVLQQAVDAAGLKTMLSNPNLKLTLLAPDDMAFYVLFQDCMKGVSNPNNVSPYCSKTQLLANQARLKDFLRYHILNQLVPVERNAFWPAGTKFAEVPTLLGKNMKLRFLNLNYETHGTGRDANVRAAPQLRNLVAGAGMLHVIDNAITYRA